MIVDSKPEIDIFTGEKNLTAYQKIAKAALMEWNSCTDEEADKIVRDESVEKLEKRVFAKSSIESGLQGILKQIDLESKENELISEIEGKVESASELEEMGKLVIETEHIDDIIIRALSDMHDNWVKTNGKKFLGLKDNGKRRNTEYMFLPLYLLSWEEAKKDLLFLKPILEASGISVDESSLQKKFEEMRIDFLKANGIDSKQRLKEKIQMGEFFYLPLMGIKCANRRINFR